MTTAASALILLAILALIIQVVLFAVRHNGTERALIIGSLGTWPLLVIWLEAALVMLIIRSFSGDRSLWDLATDGGAWVSAIGIGFALAAGALVAVRWWRTISDGEPTWNVPGSSLLAIIAAAVVGLSTLPL
ncbi:hypothetical protein [Kytococcus sedentarius]|uniref:hypothetical protein n=1 Tax=Kytococcus sedentarius TaxID=1276 RepID=UPI0035BC1FE5